MTAKSAIGPKGLMSRFQVFHDLDRYYSLQHTLKYQQIKIRNLTNRPISDKKLTDTPLKTKIQ